MSKEWWNYQISLRQASQYVCRQEESLKAKISGWKYDEKSINAQCQVCLHKVLINDKGKIVLL